MGKHNIAVDLNNEAVVYLATGNYNVAVWNLEMALDRLTAQERYLAYSKMQILNDNAIGISSVAMADNPVAETSDNVFSFFRRAFRINRPTSYGRSASNTDVLLENPTSYKLVVLYNMALAYHDDAIRRNRLSHFRRALDLYEQVLWLMHRHGLRGQSLLLLAVANNLGHIYAHFLDFCQVRSSLFWCRKLAVSSRDALLATEHEEDFRFFYRTVVIYTGRDLTIAPAA